MFAHKNKKEAVMYKNISKDKEKLSSLQRHQELIFAKSRGYLKRFEESLSKKIDIRLVRTFYDVFISIILFRDNHKGLLLSELGRYVCGPAHAPAGTKRISNLFRSKKWSCKDLADEQVEKAKIYVEEQHNNGHRILAFSDDSTVEKAESWKAEGLCPVFSSKASRLTRIKPGYYKKPASRICVPGFEWSGMVIGGLTLTPMLCFMEWWTTKGKHRDCKSNIFYRMLKAAKENFGSMLTHVLDRGYASADTLEKMFHFGQTFIIRWKSNYILETGKGDLKKTHLVCFKKKSMHRRVVEDKERKQKVRIEIIYEAVRHPEFIDNQLYLVVIRNKSFNHQPPMYLLTNCEVDSIGIAWEMFFSYIKRWDIEQTFRFNKSELGIQSIRLWDFENRKKMMMLVTLVFDFLLQFWRNWQCIAWGAINYWCPRTGNRLAEIHQPIYRLRAAFSIALTFVWAQNSG